MNISSQDLSPYVVHSQGNPSPEYLYGHSGSGQSAQDHHHQLHHAVGNDYASLQSGASDELSFYNEPASHSVSAVPQLVRYE